MKTLTAIILMITLAASSAFATAQYPDKIFYEGKEYSLHTNAMDSYFADHPDKKPKGEVLSTALWRGYVATFAFTVNVLVLKDIEIEVRVENKEGPEEYKWKSVINDVVPGDEALQIDWFTGILVLPHGERENYARMGYESTDSDYILLEVKNGQLTGKREFNHEQYQEFKEKQFQAYKKTDAYEERLEKLKNDGHSAELADSLLRDLVMKYTSKFLVPEKEDFSDDLAKCD